MEQGTTYMRHVVDPCDHSHLLLRRSCRRLEGESVRNIVNLPIAGSGWKLQTPFISYMF
jgi:hypothetical protein